MKVDICSVFVVCILFSYYWVVVLVSLHRVVTVVVFSSSFAFVRCISTFCVRVWFWVSLLVTSWAVVIEIFVAVSAIKSVQIVSISRHSFTFLLFRVPVRQTCRFTLVSCSRILVLARRVVPPRQSRFTAPSSFLYRCLA